MNNSKLPDYDTCFRLLSEGVIQYLEKSGITEPTIVGIRTGGVWIAQQLHKNLGLRNELGVLDISFYRDDFSRIGLNPQVRPSSLPVDITGLHILLVDDVLYTGRTIRAAMNELFDFGRPASVSLCVLVDRGARELPIQANVAGVTLQLPANQQVELNGPDPITLEIVAIPETSR